MTRHVFEPSSYHLAYGAQEPVMRIADGDTVVTSILDGDGRDAQLMQESPPGNPQSGPFYVEGAEPGDMLGLRIDRLTPNRRSGFSSAALAANVVDPTDVPDLPPVAYAQTIAEWECDVDRGLVTLTSPETTLGRLSIPFAPMLGCFGVAPAEGQVISAVTCGQHGGNMDYRGFAPGVTAYLPVATEGALLSVGDGHAAQGDGEIVGSGVEISMEVEFTVWIVKGHRALWPRGETDDYIFTVGNARPLDQALQHATSEMFRWLQQSFGLDEIGASLLLGQCVEYDVGNMYSPAYTMVCKLQKKHLHL